VAKETTAVTAEQEALYFPFASSLQRLARRATTMTTITAAPPPPPPPPLRLLVIGDSLAAGVGTSQSGTPVLPLSIATIVSELTGRPVEWFCRGVPGQSSDRLVSDIRDNLTNDEMFTFSDFFLRRLHDFQHQQRARLAAATESTKEWWAHQREEDHRQIERESNERSVDNDDKNSFSPMRWWHITKAKVVRDYQRVAQIVRVALNAKPPDEAHDNDEEEEEEAFAKQPPPSPLVRRRTIVIDPQIIARYDVAVVFTGANDLKEAYLPFMMPKEEEEKENPDIDDSSVTDTSSSKSSTADDRITTTKQGGLIDQFVRILHALEDKMRVGIALGQPATAAAMAQLGCSTGGGEVGPLVVFPALPYEPTVLNRLAPLSWFLIPMLKSVDRSKQRLAQLYPDRVLYVGPPDLRHEARMNLADTLAQEIPPFISLQDIQQDVKSHLEQLMRQHYDEFATAETSLDHHHEESYLYELIEGGDEVRCAPTVPPLPDVVSADGIHPSDRGYKAWGRHIGEAIVAELRRRRTLVLTRPDHYRVDEP
jgi:lysophospholipase L1-like esterase